MNLENHITNFRRGIGDQFYPERYIVEYLNKALNKLAQNNSVLKQFEGRRSWSAVANQSTYAMPAIHAQRDLIVKFDNDPLKEWDKMDLESLPDADRFATNSEPTHFCIFDGKLELWKVPSTAATSTTLDGSITASSTSITLDSVSGLKTSGRALIDSEVVSWTSLNSTTKVLSGVERGLEGTLAAAHSDEATFTERDIEWFGGLYPKKFLERPSRSATLAAGTGTNVTDGQHYVYVSAYSSRFESESLLTEIDSITSSSGTIQISNLPISDDDDVDYKRIYMTKADETDAKYYVAQISNDTTSYEIEFTDAVIGANSTYRKFESDFPLMARTAIDDMAVHLFFKDNEQSRKAAERKNDADETVAKWIGNLAGSLGNGYNTIG